MMHNNSEQSNHAMMRMMEDAQLLPAPAPAPALKKQAVAGGSRATAINLEAMMPSQSEMDGPARQVVPSGRRAGPR